MNDISEPVQVKKPTGIPLESIFANEPDVNTVPLGDRWKYWLPPNPELGKETWVIELKSEIAAALYNISEDNVNRIESIDAHTDWEKFKQQPFTRSIEVANKYREIRYLLNRFGSYPENENEFPKYQTPEEAEQALCEIEEYMKPFQEPEEQH